MDKSNFSVGMPFPDELAKEVDKWLERNSAAIVELQGIVARYKADLVKESPEFAAMISGRSEWAVAPPPGASGIGGNVHAPRPGEPSQPTPPPPPEPFIQIGPLKFNKHGLIVYEW